MSENVRGATKFKTFLVIAYIVLFYCLFYPMNILLYTSNSSLYFVLIRTEDDRRTVETCF